MHGRKQKQREEEAREPPEVRTKRTARLRKLRALLETGLACRAVRDGSDEALELTANLLCINPSINTLWNVRRDALLGRAEAPLPDAAPSVAGVDAAAAPDPDAERGTDAAVGNTAATAPSASPAASDALLERRRRLVRDELALNQQALTKGNVKSHEAWSHRAWVVEVLGQAGALVDLQRELELCKGLLSSDERNFHCYQYRALVARLAGHTTDDDLAFAQQLIDRNFSNYSAWHLKIKSLETKERDGVDLGCEALAAEFEAVNNALFTEPDDQSGWMFHRWLTARLSGGRAGVPEHDTEARLALLREQAMLVAELNELENGSSKWAMLALVRMTVAEGRLAEKVEGVDPGPKLEEARNICTRLAEVDPSHHRYYEHLSDRVAFAC
mmetsp:Transcript_6004/g.19367  ORF Transcript_6004/g.19367 Transcript_6004/m.19367 type:complete len:387 (-) Transcript_6004:1965-3125(-)